MPTVALSPLFNGWQGFTSSGIPLNAGKIYTYISGGTTPQATYTTSAGSVQNANPIILGADGRPPNEIWLIQAGYRFDLKDSADNLIMTYDNVPGYNGLSITAGKTPAITNSITFSGTDGTTMTFPTTSATIARTDALQTFTGVQTFSNGINFGQTTLTYYGEGTWTPNVGGNATYASQQGVYTRVGRLCICHFRINIVLLGTGAAGTLSGLPFSNNGATEYGGSIYFWVSLAASPVFIAPHCVSSNSTVIFEGITAAGASTSSLSPFGNSAGMYGFVSFFV